MGDLRSHGPYSTDCLFFLFYPNSDWFSFLFWVCPCHLNLSWGQYQNGPGFKEHRLCLLPFPCRKSHGLSCWHFHEEECLLLMQKTKVQSPALSQLLRSTLRHLSGGSLWPLQATHAHNEKNNPQKQNLINLRGSGVKTQLRCGSSLRLSHVGSRKSRASGGKWASIQRVCSLL